VSEIIFVAIPRSCSIQECNSSEFHRQNIALVSCLRHLHWDVQTRPPIVFSTKVFVHCSGVDTHGSGIEEQIVDMFKVLLTLFIEFIVYHCLTCFKF